MTGSDEDRENKARSQKTGTDSWESSTYGQCWADVYDEAPFVSSLSPPGLVADVLADMAGDGPALELGIGTGRIALPLAERGVHVTGIDAAPEMVDKLRDKPGGENIDVAIGDFADVDVDDTFPLVFAVFNTFFALTTQDAQVACFANVAEHLGDRGVFVIEAFVPDPTRFDEGQTVRTTALDTDTAHFELSQHDPATQRITSQQVTLRHGEPIELRPIQLRYAYPSELDLMARLAGLRLRNRWAGWDRTPFTASASIHISVYERTGS